MYLVLPLRTAIRYFVVTVLMLGIPFFTGYLISRNEKAVTTAAPAPIYQGSGEKRIVALTFNVDWGEEHLPRLLQILREHKVKATFFLAGRWTEKHPELAREIGRGFEVGNHGYGHRHPERLSAAENLAELKNAEAVIKRVTKKRPQLFAPPYGECSPAVLQAAAQAGYRVILWSVDPVDWRQRPPDEIRSRVTGQVHNGAIVLLHPTASTVEALPGIIKDLAGRGFAFVTVSELIAEE